ncbi:uncharacterized protein PGTG_13285 [Puccinia graminis f. sp. tritici CRL 75-36-700-3]|uniref:Uncharacterized protein n=1 Tax=Puccinia graminis f. sp. tritici (strain CRL 75-36-700-3 / race SCCL) TaxID=418459 RepID=E3KRZ1_PUCGT|nr:uncharacterized protein PGTG_13285 [Puccinia graminis f. sp. tritici CRL 75-36-700-3]EFP87066.1 hypothetical protein PGTG_13285 [Puccinia graminis f. sp. tritici CRL 75-36-700-3]
MTGGLCFPRSPLQPNSKFRGGLGEGCGAPITVGLSETPKLWLMGLTLSEQILIICIQDTLCCFTKLRGRSHCVDAIDSWFSTSPRPAVNDDPATPISVEEPSEESVIDALRYAGFSVTENQFMRAPKVGTTQHLSSDQLTSSPRGRKTFPFPHVLHTDASSTRGNAQIEYADLVKNRGLMNRDDLGGAHLPDEKLTLEKEGWMTKQINFFSASFARTLHRLHPKPNQIQYLYTRKHLKNLSLILTKMQANDLTATAFCWIAHRNGSYVERDRLIKSFESLITFVTYYHSNVLKKLHVKTDVIQSLNQTLLEWLYAEILNPPIGFPIMGDITRQKVSYLLAEEQPMFGKLNAFLGHFFGQLKPQPKPATLSCILINFWYFSKHTQMWRKVSEDQDHCLALKEQIEGSASVPYPRYFLSQFLT